MEADDVSEHTFAQAHRIVDALNEFKGAGFKVDLGDIEFCSRCHEFSCYCALFDDEYTNLKLGLQRIPTCSGLGEWQCGHCGTHWVHRDSPLNSECYTHRSPDEDEDG